MHQTWRCSRCGAVHHGIPFSYAYDRPYYWHTVPEDERSRRVFLSEDYCVIDNSDFFIRGCIEIPVIGREERLLWGVWASLSEKNFKREMELMNSPGRVNEPPYFGWMATEIELYEASTLGLKTNVRTRAVGQRPWIELQPCAHPLFLEQQDGVSTGRLKELAEQHEHGVRLVRPETRPAGS